MSSSERSLDEWIHYCEQLHPLTMDFSEGRLKIVLERLNLSWDCPIFTVAGTNGKGSTCAMLESILRHAGFRVGVYSSPHLVRFNERLHINGQNIDDQAIVHALATVDQVRLQPPQVSLSFFEFATLAMFSIMTQSNLDAIILEVGLGGRLDAVNTIDTDCAIITSIDLDHTELLGCDRESIGREKAGIMRSGKPVIVSDPIPPHSLIAHAQAIGADLWLNGVDFFVSGDQQQWTWVSSKRRGLRRYASLAYPSLRGANQLINAAGVLAALTALRDRLPVTAQAIRQGFAEVALPGRFQIVPGKPVMVLDVAHNPHAMAHLVNNLDAMGFYPKNHVIIGMMSDKDIIKSLKKLSSLVDAWYFTNLPTARAATANDLQSLWQVHCRTPDVATHIYSNPIEALSAAVRQAGPDDRILVCGSFYTVGGVLERGLDFFRSLTSH